MTNSEFSNLFSTMLDSYGSKAEFGDQASHHEIVLDEYEKSLFLTQAQDIIVKSYFDARLNAQGQGFDDSARRQTDFSSLIKVAELDEETNSTTGVFDDRGIIFKMPRRYVSSVAQSSNTVGTTTTYTTTYTSTVTDTPADDNTDVLFILNEKLLLKASGDESAKTEAEYVIVPISAQEYDRQMTKAYAKPLKKQAWRLFQNKSTGFDVMTELIPREELPSGKAWKYKLRYVKRPRPIILEDLTGQGLTIDGISAETTCELNPILHVDILNKAVELAISTHGRTQPTNQQQAR